MKRLLRYTAEWFYYAGYWAHSAHTLHGRFWQLQQVPERWSPLVYYWPTYELSHPYRTSYSIVLRPPYLKTALVLGHWQQITDPLLDEEVVRHLARAIGTTVSSGLLSPVPEEPQEVKETAIDGETAARLYAEQSHPAHSVARTVGNPRYSYWAVSQPYGPPTVKVYDEHVCRHGALNECESGACNSELEEDEDY
jgi:hypothetical protein